MRRGSNMYLSQGRLVPAEDYFSERNIGVAPTRMCRPGEDWRTRLAEMDEREKRGNQLAGTTTTTNTANGTERKPLWPNNLQIEVLGLTGEFASGKTLFALSIAPGPDTLVYDCEKSAGTYSSLGFHRVDLPALMLAKFPNGYRPIDLFQFWRQHIKALATRYRVIVLDPVSEIETGLVEYVRKNPREFGYTESQFARAEALMWGAAKDLWKSVLSDLASRCECFVFTSHLRQVWKGNTPSGKKAPKGKDTLMELASLYLELERKPNAKGEVPAVPAAKVLKSRLAVAKILEDGTATFTPILPPRLPIATPAAIRQYILSPPDYDKLKKGELAPEEVISEGELQSLKLATAEAERETEALRNERLNRAAAAQATATTITPTTAQASGVATTLPAANGTSTQRHPASSYGEPNDPIDPFGNAPTVALLSNLKAHKEHLAINDEQWKAILAKRGVTTARELNKDQAEELLVALGKKYAEKLKREKESATEGTTPTSAAAGN